MKSLITTFLAATCALAAPTLDDRFPNTQPHYASTQLVLDIDMSHRLRTASRIRGVTVSIEFGSNVEGHETAQLVKLPLREKIYSGDLPTFAMRPSTAEILGAMATMPNSERLEPYEDWKDIVCIAYPSSPRDDARQSEDRPVWWTARDGHVDFEDARTRWYLEGKAVLAYECI